MKLEQSFEVDAPLERVWQALIDVERVAPCLPGAAVTGRNDDGTYNGTFTIKIGPTTASYTGKLEMQNVDEGAHSASMHAQGSDKRGQGGATATIVSTLSPAGGGGTNVEVVTDYHITGRLARFGRGGMIEDISERLLREFASRLQSSLSGGGGTGGASEEDPTAVHAVVGREEEAETPPPTEVATPAEEPVEPEPEPPAPPEAAPGAPVPPPPPAAVEEEPPAAAVAPQPEPPAPEPEPPARVPEPEPLAHAPEPPARDPAAAAEPSPPIEPTPPPPPPPPAAAAPPPPPPPPPGREEAPPPPPPPRPPVEPSEPLDAGSLVGSVVVDRAKRNLKPVIAVAGGLLLLRLLRRRR